jgi:hypothetical protein
MKSFFILLALVLVLSSCVRTSTPLPQEPQLPTPTNPSTYELGIFHFQPDNITYNLIIPVERKSVDAVYVANASALNKLYVKPLASEFEGNIRLEVRTEEPNKSWTVEILVRYRDASVLTYEGTLVSNAAQVSYPLYGNTVVFPADAAPSLTSTYREWCLPLPANAGIVDAYFEPKILPDLDKWFTLHGVWFDDTNDCLGLELASQEPASIVNLPVTLLFTDDKKEQLRLGIEVCIARCILGDSQNRKVYTFK